MLKRFFIASVLFLLCSVAVAQLSIPRNTPNQSLEGSTNTETAPVFYYYDDSASFNVDTFKEHIVATEKFLPFKAAELGLGNGDHWLFLEVPKQEADSGKSWLLEIDFPNIDYVEVCVLYSNGTQERFLTGDEVAFSTWPVQYRKPSIPLRLLQSNSATVYFRVKSETPLIFPLELKTAQQQQSLQSKEHFLYGLFYGSIFILAIYNAGIYISLRDKSYRFYVLYILAFSLVQASTTGLGQQYLWPDAYETTTRFALLAILITNFFMIHFVINFLDIKTHQPRLFVPLQWLAACVLLLAPTLLLPQYAYTQYATHAMNVLGMIVIIGITISVLHKNRRPAIYLLTSYSILFSAIIIALMFQADLIEHYSFIDYIMSAAILVEAIILSIGLSERIAQLRLENETAEREARIIQEELTQQLIQTREHERAEISRLLHDSINHDLVVVRNRLQHLAQAADTAGSEAETAKEMASVDDILNKTITEVRNISHLSHPQIVKHLGLEPALNALLENTFDSSISWDVHIEDIPLSYDIQLLLYRAVQESTTNMIKHAHATQCLIRLHRKRAADDATFIIRDDGIGFNASPVNWRFGLRTLNEHCKSLAVSLTVESSASHGTTLLISIPLTSKALA